MHIDSQTSFTARSDALVAAWAERVNEAGFSDQFPVAVAATID
jgi:hypothetical protein